MENKELGKTKKYILTEMEKEWLKNRSKAFVHVSDYKDAAEFEAKVGNILLTMLIFGTSLCSVCHDVLPKPFKRQHNGCKRCLLKHARLLVEEEMENEA